MTTTMLNPRIVFGATLITVAVAAIVMAGIRNIQTSQGPKERQFILWMTPILWLLLGSFIATVYWFAMPWRLFAGLIHLALVPTFMYQCTLRRQLIREWESRQAPSSKARSET